MRQTSETRRGLILGSSAVVSKLTLSETGVRREFRHRVVALGSLIWHFLYILTTAVTKSPGPMMRSSRLARSFTKLVSSSLFASSVFF